MRIARSVKARLREKIEELIAREVAKTVVSKLKSANWKGKQQDVSSDELEQYGR